MLGVYESRRLFPVRLYGIRLQEVLEAIYRCLELECKCEDTPIYPGPAARCPKQETMDKSIRHAYTPAP